MIAGFASAAFLYQFKAFPFAPGGIIR